MRSPPDRGLTLLELLLALALLSIATALVLGGGSAAGEEARFEAAVAAVSDLDARARLAAKTLGPVVLVARPQGSAEIRSAETGERLSASDAGGAVHLKATSGKGSVLFDAAGRSESYRVEVARGERVRAWRVCGETGWIEEEAR